MKTSVYLFLTMTLYLTFSCGESQIDRKDDEKECEEKELIQNIMKIHDKAMDKAEEMYNIYLQLEDLSLQMDSLRKKIPGLDTAMAHQRIRDLLVKMDSIDEVMSDWMRQFEPDMDEDGSYEEEMQILRNAKEKIIDIDSLYAENLKSANLYLHEISK